MRNKIYFAILVWMMAVCQIVPVFAGSAAERFVDHKDFVGTAHESILDELTAKDVLKGRAIDGRLYAAINDSITRDEFIALVVRAYLGMDLYIANDDFSNDGWGKRYIDYARLSGLIPAEHIPAADRPLSLSEMTTILSSIDPEINSDDFRNAAPSRMTAVMMVEGFTRNAPKPEKLSINPDDPRFRSDENKAFFWSGRTEGFGGANNAQRIAEERGGVTLEILIDTRGIVMPPWEPSNEASIRTWQEASAAYATQASGVVWAIIGAEMRPGNVWENFELPALKRNPRVTKIYQIDPKYTDREPIVIFER